MLYAIAYITNSSSPEATRGPCLIQLQIKTNPFLLKTQLQTIKPDTLDKPGS